MKGREEWMGNFLDTMKVLMQAVLSHVKLR